MAGVVKLVIITAVLSLILAVAAVDLQHKSGKSSYVSLSGDPLLSSARAAKYSSYTPRNVGAHKKTCRPTRCSTHSLPICSTTSTTATTTQATTTETDMTTTEMTTTDMTTTEMTTTEMTTTDTTTDMTTEMSTSEPPGGGDDDDDDRRFETTFIGTSEATTESYSGPKKLSSTLSNYRRDIGHHVKLGAEFLKRAARMTGTLDKEDKKKLKLGAMERMSREILSYAETLSASLGTRTDSGTQRGSHLKSRPTCTVTSGYWDRECQCEFIHHHHHHHHHHTTTTTPATTTTTTRRPKPKPSRPSRPTYPWHHENYYPQPMFSQVHHHFNPQPTYIQNHHQHPPIYNHHEHYYPPSHDHGMECLLDEFHCLLEAFSNHIQHSHGPVGPGGIRGGEHGEHGASKSPALSLVGKLQAMLSNQTLTRHLESSGGLEMKLFLTHKMADLDKMAMYQLGQDGAEQPLLQQLLHSVIIKMEELN